MKIISEGLRPYIEGLELKAQIIRFEIKEIDIPLEWNKLGEDEIKNHLKIAENCGDHMFLDSRNSYGETILISSKD